MTMARVHLMDLSLARWYRCVTRCVSRAFLPGKGEENRKEWNETGLRNSRTSSQWLSAVFR